MNSKFEQGRLPFAPIIASRVPVFSATNKSPYRWERETQWGRVVVEGKLDQTHRDVLDAIMKTALNHHLVEETGDMLLMVDLYQVRKTLSVNGASINNTQIFDKVKEMRQTSVMIWDNQRQSSIPSHLGSIISGYKEIKLNQANSRSGVLNGEDSRLIWKLTISSAWVRLMNEGLVYRYDQHLDTIRAMRRDVSKAVTRFMLTHQQGATYSLRDILLMVSSNTPNPATLRQWESRIFDDVELMMKCGVLLSEDKTIKRLKDEKISVYS